MPLGVISAVLNFKQRFTDHKTPFENIKQRIKTTLDKYVLNLKETDITPRVVLERGFPYPCGMIKANNYTA